MITFYGEALSRNARARAFLVREGLSDPTLIRRFQLGFSDRTLGRASTASVRPTGAFQRAELTSLGLLRPSGHEHFGGCVVVPLWDASGSIRQFYGRRIAPPRGTPRPALSLPGAEPALWNAAALSESGDLVLCDDVLDALTLWSVGHHRVLACSRADGEVGIAMLARLVADSGVARVHVAFRADARGNRAAHQLGRALALAGIDLARLPLPRGFDVRTFARVHPPAEESLRALLRGVLPTRPLAAAWEAASRPVDVAWPNATGTVPSPLTRDIESHLASLAADGRARSTIGARRLYLDRFAASLVSQGVRRTAAVSTESLDRFRVALAASVAAGTPVLSAGTQANLITAVRMFFAWAVRTRRVVADPTVDLVRPRLPQRLPRAVLSASEAERVLARPDTATALGLRDRAILEVLYSTGIRRMELIGLDLPDLDAERGVLFIREGKGRKDRFVPIGERAIHWTHRYLDRSRPRLVRARDPGALFLAARGARVRPSRLTERLHGYVLASGVGKSGSCHIFRHTMATLMHEGGADIRDLQEMLGHALLTTTQIYTHVSIARLKEVHSRTHPARFAP